MMIDETSVNYVIDKLPEHLHGYARAWFAHMKGSAAAPTIKDFNISYSEGQRARLALAASL